MDPCFQEPAAKPARCPCTNIMLIVAYEGGGILRACIYTRTILGHTAAQFLHYSSKSGIYSHTLQDEVDEMRRRRAGAAPEAEEVEMAAEESTLNPKPLKPL